MKRFVFLAILAATLGIVLRMSFADLPARVHDPSTIVRCNDEYWLFNTGFGIPSWHSRDLITWRSGPQVFPAPPSWITHVVPGQIGYFWAPDVIQLRGRYALYYAISRWGSRTSAIALATNATLDPADPRYHWTDEGVVTRSTDRDNFNAIDPCVMFDTNGRMWMTFGSYWTGIKLVELDPATGLCKPGAPLHALAWAKEIEAPYIIAHEGRYYLFVNWGLCCRGIDSTYNIRVGRASTITGPYRDKAGADMMAGGGTLFLGSEGHAIGPGQIGVLHDVAQEWFSYHYYDANHNGQARLGIRRLDWDSDGWPVAGPWKGE